MKKLLFDKPPIYTNISLQFTGIGHLMIHANALVSHISSKHRLNIRNLPLHTFGHAFNFILSNLRNAGFDTITLFKTPEDDLHRKVVLKFFGTLYPIKEASEVNEYLSNERIALILGGNNEKEIELMAEFGARNIYCALLEGMEFVVPHVYAFTYAAADYQIKGPISFSEDINEIDEAEFSINEVNEEISKMNSNFDFDKVKKIFIGIMNECIYEKTDDVISDRLCNMLLHYMEKHGKLNFDGRVLFTEPIKPSEGNIRSLDSLKPLCNKKQIPNIIREDIELKLLTNFKENSQAGLAWHTRNIQRSAMSLFDGKPLFAPIVRGTLKKPVKISQKQQKIIEENQKKLDKERENKNKIWLRNFYVKYKNADRKDKRVLLEGVTMENMDIYRKILLLKIEYYSEIWDLERRSEDCDEKVLIPCYLCCLEFIDRFCDFNSMNKNSKNQELEYVLQKLINCGFEASVHEIIEKNNLKVNLEFFTDDTSAPSDFDICFQLKHTGDKLQRSLNSKKDDRVLFTPDGWQIKLLDLVDAGKSAVVAAPTSSGKTFICFYAIEKILRQSDTDMVIFCLPTKALANQVSADVYARFKAKANVKTALQGYMMKDYKMHPFDCQVLITIPSLLESLLSSPPPKLIDRIKYIIIDEVHKISSIEMGSPIERIFHLSPCPLLVLSATLGNLDGFYNWVRDLEVSKGRECELVTYSDRYCELKPYVFSRKESSDSIVPISNLFAYSYEHIKKFGFGNDINFLPEELLNLFDSICAVLTEKQKELIYPLVPENFFKSNFLTKKDTKDYQEHLLRYFENLVKRNELTEKQIKKIYKLQTRECKKAFETITDFSEDYLLDNMLDLLNELKRKDMLPCIVFNTDRDFLNKMALRIYNKLEEQDKQVKKDKAVEKFKKEVKRTRDVEKSKDSWIEDSLLLEKSFELVKDKKDINYTFLDPVYKMTDYELDEETRGIKNTEFAYIDMLYRGIGVHHEQINKKYRNLAEILFRRKHLGVLFATDTLALGINMPCRTVVFAGDSILLDPLNYKQMAGRAGRRGYDTIGNIVFLGLPERRVQNLMVSLLPNIRGNYSFTNSSFIGFNIKESLIKYPLLEKTMCTSSGLEGLSLSSTSYDLRDIFLSEEKRRFLVSLQIDVLSRYFNDSSYLAELVISNRDCDPGIFIYSLLLEVGLFPHENIEFMCLLAHLFEVRPSLNDTERILPEMPSNVHSFISEINKITRDVLLTLYSPTMRTLQATTPLPLHNLLSFVYCPEVRKNSYLVDFFKHGSSKRILEENRVRSADLFRSLSILDGVISSTIRLLNKYKPGCDAHKFLVSFYSVFQPKFKVIFA